MFVDLRNLARSVHGVPIPAPSVRSHRRYSLRQDFGSQESYGDVRPKS